MPDDRLSISADSRWRVTRREALAAVGGSAVSVWTGSDTSSGTAVDTETTAGHRDGLVRIRVYPDAVPFRARLRYGLGDLRGNWPTPFRDALAAIESAFEHVLAYARERSRLEDLVVRVDRASPIRVPPSTTSLSADAVLPSLEALLRRFRERVQSRGALTGRTCHVLLCWSPLNYRVGYGGTLAPNSVTGMDDGGDGDALTVANVGATEVWDSRPVTQNIAIHETLHTFLSDDVVRSIGNAYCDHELGTAVRTAQNTLRISPMATAYAGPNRIGGGTRFHGTGCYDHDRFVRHDGHDGIENWVYTTEPSDATQEGVTRYLERRFER
ncbi:hypothetical protein [Natrinema gelatinilyticum]|uniref:hypothetical protein n=1 Tax=Natrinema gelatinilyticum TaxID=2961571 RepID=UPI0020C1F0E5|nr:hypothetical protein [Natrinema gelatinilyticum]